MKTSRHPELNNAVGTAAERSRLGRNKLKELHGDFGADVLNALDEVNPELKNWIIDFGYGTVYRSKKLDARARQIATLTALICLRHFGREFESHVRAALKIGITCDEILGIAEHCALYAGFPAALAATKAIQDVLTRLPASTDRRQSKRRTR